MTPEIITSVIAAALSSGAVTGITDTAKKAIPDAYEGLKSLIRAKWGHDSEAVDAIGKLEANPGSQGRKLTLSEELTRIDAASDPGVAAAAQSLLELVRALPKGETHTQSAVGTGIAQADRGGTAQVNFASPPESCHACGTRRTEPDAA